MATPPDGDPPSFSSPLDAALRYADLGWHVFPVVPAPGKVPLTPHGHLDASVDYEQIVQWWRQWPNAQIGVPGEASGLCCVDLDMDTAKGKDGVAFWTRLVDEHGRHGCGLIASTPRGGRHYVYLMPDPAVGTCVDLVAPNSGIDVRASGGYFIVPSPASPGREWIEGDPFTVGQDGSTDIGAMPAWVEQIVRSGRPAHQGTTVSGTSARAMVLPEAQVAAIKRALQHIDPDPRDGWIRVGMALKSTGAREQAYDLWCQWSSASNKFDLEVQWKQWNSLHEYFYDGREVTLGTLFFLAKQGGYTPPIEDEVTVAAIPPYVDEPIAKMPEKKPFPRDLMNVPGLVGEIATWMVASSTRRQHAMCLASALALLGAVLGRRVATPTDLRTNIYCLGIGETACGKDPSVRLPHLLLTRAQLGSLIGPGEWKSDSGLRAALLDAPSHVACCDEFTKMLDAMSGRTVPAHLKGIKRYLLELWAASNSVHLSPAYANRLLNKPVVIEQPNLCLYGTGVPSELFSSLDRGALTDGFLNRMLVFFADDQMPPRQKVGRAEPPVELVTRLQALDKAIDAGNLAMLPNATPNARVIAMATEAEQMLVELEQQNDQRILELRSRGDSLADLWVRFGAHVAKLALIRTVADDPRRQIALPDVAWARDLVLWCVERTMIEAESRVADSQQEAWANRVRRIVREAGTAGLTSNQLTRKTQWLRRSDRKDIIASLIEGADVLPETSEIVRNGRGTVQVTRYVATCFRANDQT